MNMNPPSNEGDSRPSLSTDTQSPLNQAVRWFRGRFSTRAEGTLKEMIEGALEDVAGETADISAEERSLLKNLINFGELSAYDIMVPRSDIMGVPNNVSLEELKLHVITIGHTRVPVYEDSLDNIIGFVHVKDLFPHLVSGNGFNIAQVMREILFVPPSMRIVDLLLKMRVSGCHIAIVVDEFGGTDGLVTMEDLFEQIVGEIQDEHDGHESTPTMRWSGDHTVEADARTPVEKLEKALGESLSDTTAGGDIDTLGGLIFSHLGRIPSRGEVLMLKSNLKAEILQADPRRVRLVRVTRITAVA